MRSRLPRSGAHRVNEPKLPHAVVSQGTDLNKLRPNVARACCSFAGAQRRSTVWQLVSFCSASEEEAAANGGRQRSDRRLALEAYAM